MQLRFLLASCPLDDATCPVHDGLYMLIRAGAAALWATNRVLLYGAFQARQLGNWLAHEGLSGAAAIVVGEAGLSLRALATLALYLGALAYLLLPWSGWQPGSLRRQLGYLLLATLLIQQGGPALSHLEGLRAGVGTSLEHQMQALGGPTLVSTAEGDLLAAQPLYGSEAASACNAPALAQQQQGADALAARFLLADAADIHCPARRGPADDLPDAFFAGSRYFVVGNLEGRDAPDRRARLDAALAGLVRQASGLLPCALAALAASIDLLFTLALAAVVLGIVPTLLAGVLLPVEGLLAQFGRRLLAVLLRSWGASLLQGLALILLRRTAAGGSSTAFLAACLACLLLLALIARTALATFSTGLGTLAWSRSLAASMPTPHAPWLSFPGTGERSTPAEWAAPLPQRAAVAASAALPQGGLRLQAGEIARAMAADDE